MYSICFKIALVCLLAASVESARDDSVCQPIKESHGLIPPPLPRDLELKGEVANIVNQTLMWQEVYFDNTNSRAKLMVISDLVEFHFIFDYVVEQVVQYMVVHPGAVVERDPESEECIATPMDTSQWKYIFGYKETDGQGKKSRMYNSYEMLRYGGKYLYAAQGTDYLNNRELRGNKFVSCIYDSDFNFTANSTFYFSDEKTYMAAGTIGSDGELISVPIQINMDGTVMTKPAVGKPFPMAYSTQQSLSWFDGTPKFGYDTFMIPQGLYCKNYKGYKAFPFLPTRFSTRIEETSFTQDENGTLSTGELLINHEIWYDVENNLARRDFMPVLESDKEIRNKFQSMSYVKTIYDFNTGILYTINKASGRCFARTIVNGDYFETSKEHLQIRMGSPEEFLMMERDTLEYKGQDFVRDINTDVWAGKSYNQPMNITLYMESFMATNGWSEEVEEEVQFNMPIRHVIYADRTEGDTYQQTVTQMNFFKFKPTPPPLRVFNLFSTACLDTIGRRYLGIELSITEEDWTTARQYVFVVREAAQAYIANVSKVGTPLRIQAVNVRTIANTKMILFALLNYTTLDTKTLVQQRGASIDAAIENLRKQIDDGNFYVEFLIPGKIPEEAPQTKQIMGKPKGFVGFRVPLESTAHLEQDMTSYSYEQISPVVLNYVQHHEDHKLHEQIWYDEQPNVVLIQGMTAGGLAGLAIGMLIIGIGVGICIMYLYIRKFGNGRSHDHAMHTLQSR